jgi:phage terminase small subunit
MPRKNGGLTPKQERFVAEYLVDLNASQAAIRAGYSAKNPNVVGPRLLANVGIAAAVEAGKAARAKRTGITADRVLAELEGMAFARWEHFEDDGRGNPVPKADAPPHVSAALQTVKRKEWSDGKGDGHTVETEWRLAPKLEALRLAGRHAGLKSFWDRFDPEVEEKPTSLEIYGGLPPDVDDKPAVGSA